MARCSDRRVAGILGADGKFLRAQEKHLDLALEDATVRQLFATGIDGTPRFQMIPGNCIAREIVLDSEEQRVTAVSQKLEVP